VDVAQPSRPGLLPGPRPGRPGHRAFFFATRMEEAPSAASGGAGAAPHPPRPSPRPAGGSHCPLPWISPGAGWWVTGATGRREAGGTIARAKSTRQSLVAPQPCVKAQDRGGGRRGGGAQTRFYFNETHKYKPETGLWALRQSRTVLASYGLCVVCGRPWQTHTSVLRTAFRFQPPCLQPCAAVRQGAVRYTLSESSGRSLFRC
jgi:hypothetical protein